MNGKDFRRSDSYFRQQFLSRRAREGAALSALVYSSSFVLVHAVLEDSSLAAEPVQRQGGTFLDGWIVPQSSRVLTNFNSVKADMEVLLAVVVVVLYAPLELIVISRIEGTTRGIRGGGFATPYPLG